MVASNTHGSWWPADDLALALLFTVIMVVALLWYKKRSISSSKNGTPPLPPGPFGLPVVGYFPFLGPSLHLELHKMVPHYGPIFKFYLGRNLHIVVNSADLAKVVTGEQDESFANRAPHIAGLATSYNASDIAFADNNANRRKLRKLLVHQVLSNVNLEASHAYRRDDKEEKIFYKSY